MPQPSHTQVSRTRQVQPVSQSQSPSSSSTPLGRLSSSSIRSPRLNLPSHERYNALLTAPYAWTSTTRTWTTTQLQRERHDFFDTRVTGRPEIWDALQNVCELVRAGDIATAQGILDAAGITLPTGTLVDGCYDEAGNLYRLPEVVVSDPVNTARGGDSQEEAMVDVGSRNSNNIDGETIIGVPDAKLATTPEEKLLHGVDGDVDKEDTDTLERRREKKGKASERDAVKVRCRLSDRGGPDVVIALAKTQHVATLVRRVQVEGKVCLSVLLSVGPRILFIPNQKNAITLPESGKIRLANTPTPPLCHQQVSPSLHIRLAYLGKILNEKDTLEAQGWKEGHVINAMVVGSES